MNAVRLVERYLFELYNDRQLQLVYEICGDPMVRHAAGSVTALNRDQQFARIEADLAAHEPEFSVVTLVGDDTHASLTWNAVRRATGEKLCGIEIFKADGGVITDVWNSGYFEGSWS
ncbi:hypothetical protein CH253_05380 [Rhodococcus sp. 06-156-3C]|uniref:hypothetical protein n=1 Tax=Nocardiaceae TaxID=85025 RepID=UPI0003769942|nr:MULTISPECIES: hypothetical protein [Rhodococcus]OZC50841.1 hypothetical protein CH267_22575 [Rhodococcus sp. 06-621-2]OZC84379.1 hypothetical protein CH282_14635 [Rhodococcus sp. 06-418-1B]OZD11124.1 hypothetical protein CH280_20535 [Rhodococcus sp. 06-156-4C]OZD14540.1 hypothetical protein CH248_24610 [Rhodococcus sp. 06-156-4a]OZD24874.1 hypothetical protein CH253_05380 [Rhodococcus sp. 06-156-3C]